MVTFVRKMARFRTLCRYCVLDQMLRQNLVCGHGCDPNRGKESIKVVPPDISMQMHHLYENWLDLYEKKIPLKMQILHSRSKVE